MHPAALLSLLLLALLAPAEARWGKGGGKGMAAAKRREEDMEMFEQLKREREDLDEDELLDKLAAMRRKKDRQTKRENAGKKKDWGNVDDPLRNGTYVRYGAGVLFVLLLGGIFWAFRDGLESKDHRHKRVGKLV